MKSMTGYAYEELNNDDLSLSVEIKSYNSRFLDLSINLPSFLSRLEMTIREKVADKIARGKVDVYIKIKEKNSKLSVSADTQAALEYASAISEIAGALGRSEPVPLKLIIEQEGVLNVQKDFDPDYYWNFIGPLLDKALNQFVDDRKREGDNLCADILKMVNKIDGCVSLFTEWQPKMEELFKSSIVKRFEEVLGDKVDEQRVMQETAALLVKYTINEEIVRLKSHISALKKEIETNPAPGRKLDFICQEMNREINTIGSKNQVSEVGAAVITAKDALENIREQIRNIE